MTGLVRKIPGMNKKLKGYKNMLTIYSKKDCPKCVQLKDICKQAGVNYEEFDITDRPEIRNSVISLVQEGTGFPIALFDDGYAIAGDMDSIVAKINTQPMLTRKKALFYWGRDAEGNSADTW